MLEVTKIAEVKDKVQPVLLEEVPQLKLVVIRSQHNHCIEKAALFGPAFFVLNPFYSLHVFRPSLFRLILLQACHPGYPQNTSFGKRRLFVVTLVR